MRLVTRGALAPSLILERALLTPFGTVRRDIWGLSKVWESFRNPLITLAIAIDSESTSSLWSRIKTACYSLT